MSFECKVKEKLERLNEQDIDYILKLIDDEKLKGNQYEAIIKYLNILFENNNIQNLNRSFNIFFIDTIELLLTMLSEEKINGKIDIDMPTVKKLLKFIKDIRCTKKAIKVSEDIENNNVEDYILNRDDNNINEDFCITVVSRLPMVLTEIKESLKNTNSIQKHIINYFKDVNYKFTDIFKKSTSIMKDELIGKNSIDRSRIKHIRKVFTIKNISKIILDEYKHKGKEGLFDLYWISKFVPIPIIIVMLGISMPSGIVWLYSYRKYKDFTTNRKYIKAFEIALIIYENEYKLIHEGGTINASL